MSDTDDGLLTNWYCWIDDEIVGPMDYKELKALFSSGACAPSTPVRRGVSGEWQDCGVIFGFNKAASVRHAVPPPPIIRKTQSSDLPPIKNAAEHSAESNRWPIQLRAAVGFILAFGILGILFLFGDALIAAFPGFRVLQRIVVVLAICLGVIRFIAGLFREFTKNESE